AGVDVGHRQEEQKAHRWFTYGLGEEGEILEDRDGEVGVGEGDAARAACRAGGVNDRRYVCRGEGLHAFFHLPVGADTARQEAVDVALVDDGHVDLGNGLNERTLAAVLRPRLARATVANDPFDLRRGVR